MGPPHPPEPPLSRKLWDSDLRCIRGERVHSSQWITARRGARLRKSETRGSSSFLRAPLGFHSWGCGSMRRTLYYYVCITELGIAQSGERRGALRRSRENDESESVFNREWAKMGRRTCELQRAWGETDLSWQAGVKDGALLRGNMAQYFLSSHTPTDSGDWMREQTNEYAREVLQTRSRGKMILHHISLSR